MTKSNSKNVTKDSINEKCFAYQRKYTKDNLSYLKQTFLRKAGMIMDSIDVECDNNMFIERLKRIYDECIPLMKYKVKFQRHRG